MFQIQAVSRQFNPQQCSHFKGEDIGDQEK